MTDLELLQFGWENYKRATVHKKWERSNPAEAAKLDAFVAAILAGGNPTPPVMATAYGQGAVEWASMALPEAAPSASASASPSATPSATPSQTPSASPSATPSRSPSRSASASPSASPSPAPPPGGEGRVPFCMYATSQADSFVNAADTPAEQQWIKDHWSRAIGWAVLWDSKPWDRNVWPYRDSYAIYCSSSDTVPPTHPEWVLRNAAGQYLKFYSSVQFAADPGNPGWVAEVVAWAKAQVAKGYVGVYMDDVNLSMISGSPIDPRTGAPMTQSAWEGYIVRLMQAIRAAIPGKEVVHNKVWFDTPNHDNGTPNSKAEVSAATHVLIERGANDSGLTTGTGSWSFDRLFKYVDSIHASGPGVIWLGYGSTRQEWDFNLACALLCSNGKDLIYNNGCWSSSTWNAKWDYDLGAAKGPRYSAGGNLVRRDFAKGYATADVGTRVGTIVVTG